MGLGEGDEQPVRGDDGGPGCVPGAELLRLLRQRGVRELRGVGLGVAFVDLVEDPARVVEQHPEGHRGFRADDAGQQVADHVAQGQLTPLDRLEHQGCNDRFGDARDAERVSGHDWRARVLRRSCGRGPAPVTDSHDGEGSRGAVPVTRRVEHRLEHRTDLGGG